MKDQYQVLWIDDQWEKFTSVIKSAKKKNIIFEYARTSEEGLKLYKTH